MRRGLGIDVACFIVVVGVVIGHVRLFLFNAITRWIHISFFFFFLLSIINNNMISKKIEAMLSPQCSSVVDEKNDKDTIAVACQLVMESTKGTAATNYRENFCCCCCCCCCCWV
jgi:hypothetical protein